MKGRLNGWRYGGRKEETRMKSNYVWRENVGTPRYGRRRERRWTPTQAVTQDTWDSPNSLENHLVRQWGDIGHQRTVGPRIIQYSTVCVQIVFSGTYTVVCVLIYKYMFLVGDGLISVEWWLGSNSLGNPLGAEMSFSSAPLANQAYWVHCWWEDERTKGGTGHPPSYAEANKMKSLTLHA